MSLFDKDDFYSAKRPSRAWTRRDENPMWTNANRGWRQIPPRMLAAVSAIGGAIVMLILMLMIISMQGGNGKPEPIVAALSSIVPTEAAADRTVQAIEKMGPSVVSILSSKKTDKGELRQYGMGSGVIFQKEGNRALIVTNNHVVEEATVFEAVLFNGERKKAKLIGSDRISDLAVLEIDADGIESVAELGDSLQLKRGETVVTIGNALGLGTSVTRGVVSSPRSTIPVSLSGDGEPDWEMEMIQIDAAINEGNSGGALVNLDGQLIGINTLKIANLTVEGMGFAIPIDDVIPILQDLIENQKVKRPLIGVTMQNLQSFRGTEVLNLPADVKTGIIVLEASGPAKAAGLRSQDIIVGIDNHDTRSILELRKYLYNEKKIGDSLTVTFYREGKKQTVNLVLAESEG